MISTTTNEFVRKKSNFRALSFLNAVMNLFFLQEPSFCLSFPPSFRVYVSLVFYIRHAIRLFVFVTHRLRAQYALTAFFFLMPFFPFIFFSVALHKCLHLS